MKSCTQAAHKFVSQRRFPIKGERSLALPTSPFLDNFRIADNLPEELLASAKWRNLPYKNSQLCAHGGMSVSLTTRQTAA
jgi:hypothetical protein